uniref:EF-hand domain-containing protein n=1 Tax=Chromera velia CCMP2878 TaxID=1169474 RepID=A0A0G4HB69_9ALVE|eukprot:Cvel_25747.t1-p1 / transcript=Cvel_25747.t1 / gene=Cvel_25747 / organism=Chromera_velia_CCMP2878 / gene_product=hypothetical protein / transcript_product=hypothetical protein / location=Cvel_scaffold2963:82-5638(-) / protein_length=1230 / sequence_SO=supercontig / SO=protein_coding / is_pseudo=false
MTSLPVLLLLQVILVCCSAETFQLLKTSAFLPLHLTRFTPLNKVSPVKLRASDGDGNGNEDLPSLDDDFFSSVEPDGGSSGTRSSPSRNNKSVVGGWRAKQRRERGSGGKDRNGPVSRPVPNIRLSEASQKLASGGDFQTVAWGDDDTEEPLSYGGGQGGVGWKGGGEFSRGGHRFSWQQPTQEQRDDFGMQGGGLMGDGVDDLFRPSLDSGLDDVLLGDFGGDDLDSVDKRMDHRRRGGGGRRRGGGRGDQFGTLQGILGFDDVDRSSLSQGLPLDESLAAELQKELATFESGGERPDSVLRGGRWAIGGDAGRGGGEKEKGQPGGLFGDVKEGSLASRLGSLWGEEEDGEGERTFQSFVAGNRERRKDQKVAKEKKDETLKLEENENGEREEKGEEGGEGPKWEDFQDLWDEMGNDKGGGLFGDEGKEETEGLFGDERGETVDFEDKDGAMTRGLFGDDEEEGEGLFEDESSLSASWGKTQEKKSKKESWGDPFDMALESEKDTESLWSDDEGLSRSSYPSFLKDGEEEGEDGSSWLRNEERRQQARGGGRESERMGSDMDFSMEREEENNLIDEDGPRNVLAGLLGRFQEPSESRLAEREETQKGGDWGGPPVPSPDSTRRDLTPSNQPRGGGGMYNQNRKATFPLPPPPVDSDPYSPQYRGALPSSSSSSFQPTRRQTYQGGRTDSWKDQRRRPQRDHQFSQRQRGGEREDVQALIAERNEARQKTTQEKAANVLRRWFNSFIEDLDTARHPRILQKRLSILRKRCEDLAQEVPGTSTHLPLHLLLPVVQKLVLWDIEFQDELMGGKGFGQAGQKQKQTDFFTLSPHPSSRLTADFTPVQKAEAQELRSSIKGLIESLFLERFSREGVAISPEDAYWILTFLRRSSPDSLSGSTSESDTQGANTYPTFQLVRQAIIRGGGLAVQMSEEDSEAVESQTKNNHQTETEQPQLAMLTLLELMHFQDRSDAFELILARVADEIQKYKNKGSLSDFPFSGDQLRSLCVYISYAREGFLSEAGLAVLSDTAELLSLAPSESVRPAANLDVVLSLVRARVEPPADLVDSLLEIVRERPEKLQGENVLKILQLQDATGGFLSVSELKAYLQGASPSLKFWSSSGKQERRRLLEGRGGIESIRLISNLLRSAAVEEEAQGEAADETKTDEQPDSLDLVLKGDDEEGEGEGGKQGARVLVKIDLEDLNPLLDLFFKDTQMDTERFRPADVSPDFSS